MEVVNDGETRALIDTYRRVVQGELTATEAAASLTEYRRDDHTRVLVTVSAGDGAALSQDGVDPRRPRRDTIRSLLLASGLADTWTPRELRIACLLVDDLTYDACAHELGVGRSTIRGAARSVCSKSGVASIHALRRLVVLVDSLERSAVQCHNRRNPE